MTANGFQIAGVVIAGGLSRRMGETDKLWIDLQGEPLIMRAARRLKAQTGNVILNVNQADERLAPLGLPVIPDQNTDYQGPLAGILACLGWLRENAPEVTHLIATSVDSPFFPEDLTERLTADRKARPDEIAIAFCDGYPQPVFGLWPVSCADALTDFLSTTDNLKVMAFVKSRPWRRVDFPSGNPPAFFNINTPGDLAMAHEFAEQTAAQ